MEVGSHTTKSTEPNTNNQKKPLIVDISSQYKNKKTLNVNKKKNKKNRRGSFESLRPLIN